MKKVEPIQNNLNSGKSLRVNGHIEVEERGSLNGPMCVGERFCVGCLRLDSGEVLRATNDHTRILPIGTRVRTFNKAEHSFTVFQDQGDGKECMLPIDFISI